MVFLFLLEQLTFLFLRGKGEGGKGGGRGKGGRGEGGGKGGRRGEGGKEGGKGGGREGGEETFRSVSCQMVTLSL